MADHYLGDGPNQKVYYRNGNKHCQGFEGFSNTSSMGTLLSDWLKNMVEDNSDWNSVRPDLSYDY